MAIWSTVCGKKYSLEPNLIWCVSLAVITARTPGNFSALEASMEMMRACGCGERSIFPTSILGKLTSKAYLVWPVTIPLPSMRGTLLTTGSTYSFKNVFLTGITILILQCFHLLTRVTDRVKDL